MKRAAPEINVALTAEQKLWKAEIETTFGVENSVALRKLVTACIDEGVWGFAEFRESLITEPDDLLGTGARIDWARLNEDEVVRIIGGEEAALRKLAKHEAHLEDVASLSSALVARLANEPCVRPGEVLLRPGEGLLQKWAMKHTYKYGDPFFTETVAREKLGFLTPQMLAKAVDRVEAGNYVLKLKTVMTAHELRERRCARPASTRREP